MPEVNLPKFGPSSPTQNVGRRFIRVSFYQPLCSHRVCAEFRRRAVARIRNKYVRKTCIILRSECLVILELFMGENYYARVSVKIWRRKLQGFDSFRNFVHKCKLSWYKVRIVPFLGLKSLYMSNFLCVKFSNFIRCKLMSIFASCDKNHLQMNLSWRYL